MPAKIHQMGQGPRGGICYVFHCPGCHYGHPFEVTAPPNTQGWTWNGSFDRPTFFPSLMCNKDDPATRCHSYVTDGKIRFLEDCFHSLRGQTVELPDWD